MKCPLKRAALAPLGVLILLAGCSEPGYTNVEQLVAEVEKNSELECAHTMTTELTEETSMGCVLEGDVGFFAVLHGYDTERWNAREQRNWVRFLEEVDGRDLAVVGDAYEWTMTVSDLATAELIQEAIGGKIVRDVLEYDEMVGVYTEDEGSSDER